MRSHEARLNSIHVLKRVCNNCVSMNRYPGGLYGLYPARLPAEGTALEVEAGAVLANDLLRRYRVRYDAERCVQAITVEEFRSPAQPGTR